MECTMAASTRLDKYRTTLRQQVLPAYDRLGSLTVVYLLGVRAHHIVNAEGSRHREQHNSAKAHHIVNAVHSSCYLRRRQYERTRRIPPATSRHSLDVARPHSPSHPCAHS